MTNVALLDQQVGAGDDDAVVLDVELTVDLAGVEEEVPRLAGEHSPDPGREAEVKPLTGACSVLT